MFRLLSRVLWRQLRPAHLLGGAAGAALGLFLLLFALQFYADARELLSGSAFGQKYLIINKPVSLLNTLGVSGGHFSEDDLREIREQSFARDAAPFTHGAFNAYADVEVGQEQLGIKADLFFEAAPDKFMDVRPDEWEWSSSDETLPVVLPGDYLKLYNFGFAPSRGLPQMSEDLAGQAGLNIVIEGNGKRRVFRGELAGFSDRLNSIIVPQRFMDYANAEFGEGKPGYNRVIVEIDPLAQDAAGAWLDRKGYETNRENLSDGKLAGFVRIAAAVAGGMGAVVVALAFLVFALAFQTMLSRSRYEINLLFQLGYAPAQLLRVYAAYLGALMAALAGLCLFGAARAQAMLGDALWEAGLDWPGGLRPELYLAAAAFALVFTVLNLWLIHRANVKLARTLVM